MRHGGRGSDQQFILILKFLCPVVFEKKNRVTDVACTLGSSNSCCFTVVVVMILRASTPHAPESLKLVPS